MRIVRLSRSSKFGRTCALRKQGTTAVSIPAEAQSFPGGKRQGLRPFVRRAKKIASGNPSLWIRKSPYHKTEIGGTGTVRVSPRFPWTLTRDPSATSFYALPFPERPLRPMFHVEHSPRVVPQIRQSPKSKRYPFRFSSRRCSMWNIEPLCLRPTPDTVLE